MSEYVESLKYAFGYFTLYLELLLFFPFQIILQIFSLLARFIGFKTETESETDSDVNEKLMNRAELSISHDKRNPTIFSRIFKSIIYVFIRIKRDLLDFGSDILFGLIYRSKKSLPTINDNILLESATSLAAKIRKREVKCVDVIKSYVRRIRAVNAFLNALTDDNFDEALEEAKKVDELISSGAKSYYELEKEKPLLGVPFTIKDSVAVKGLHQIVGMVSRKDVIATDDAEVVKLMKNAGAINIANTNVPELTMWSETSNKVNGTTNNPYNFGRTCGGSSGGEGSLIAAAGSLIGIGTDLGGSIRIPSCFNGVFGHKPTPGIVSKIGELPDTVGKLKNYNTTGPMCRYAEDLLPVFKILVGSNSNKLQLDEKVDVETLRYFYMEDDGGSLFTSKVHRKIREGLRSINLHFERSYNNNPTKADIKNLKYSTEIWFVNMAASGAPSMRELMTDNKGKLNILLEFLKWLLFCSNHTLAAICMASVEVFVGKTTKFHHFYINATKELEKEFDDLLGTDGVFFYPTQPVPAPYHNQYLLQPHNLGYTGVFNILGLPSTHIPLGLNDDGLPYGVQVVANKYNDHLCLAVARELEKEFRGWCRPK